MTNIFVMGDSKDIYSEERLADFGRRALAGEFSDPAKGYVDPVVFLNEFNKPRMAVAFHYTREGFQKDADAGAKA